jgi:hypothetical protein
MRVERDKDKITLDQTSYIYTVLEKFEMQDCRAVSVPLTPGIELVKGSCKTDFPHQRLVGSLMHIAVSTRPDIMYAGSVLSRFNSCYNNEHVVAAKHILKYLKDTTHNKLTFVKNEKLILDLCGYVDAAHGNDPVDKTSHTGFTIYSF